MGLTRSRYQRKTAGKILLNIKISVVPITLNPQPIKGENHVTSSGVTPVFKPRGDEFKVESADPFYSD
jgi:hypothetical protein